MNSTMVVTAVLALGIVVLIFVRQIVQRPVTQRSLLLPLVLSVALGGVFLAGHPAPEGIAAVILGLAIGIGTGLISGQVIRVWRDEATGIVFQRGGWPLQGQLAFLDPPPVAHPRLASPLPPRRPQVSPTCRVRTFRRTA